MNRYLYDGPVEEFGRCIARDWKAATYAPTESKARSNFSYQFKKQYNRLPNAKITLPGKITVVKGESA